MHQKMEDGTLLTTRTDAKAGLLLGRNNQAGSLNLHLQARQSIQGCTLIKQDAGLQICDFEVNHKSASRVHACLAFSADGVPYCVDMGSTHGAQLSHPSSSHCSSLLGITASPLTLRGRQNRDWKATERAPVHQRAQHQASELMPNVLTPVPHRDLCGWRTA